MHPFTEKIVSPRLPRRVSSPDLGASTLMTSAPMSAISIVAEGPGHSNSTTNPQGKCANSYGSINCFTTHLKLQKHSCFKHVCNDVKFPKMMRNQKKQGVLFPSRVLFGYLLPAKICKYHIPNWTETPHVLLESVRGPRCEVLLIGPRLDQMGFPKGWKQNDPSVKCKGLFPLQWNNLSTPNWLTDPYLVGNKWIIHNHFMSSTIGTWKCQSVYEKKIPPVMVCVCLEISLENVCAKGNDKTHSQWFAKIVLAGADWSSQYQV